MTNTSLLVAHGDPAALTALVRAGYAGGTFAGPGITSSVAAADPARLTAIGVGPADGGVTLAVTTYGDADLNGTLDGRDYARIDAGYNQHLTGWYNGDFNYDGVVDGSDYTLIDNAFDRTRRPSAVPASAIRASAVPASAAVPEPDGVAVGLATGLLGMARSRPRLGRAGREAAFPTG